MNKEIAGGTIKIAATSGTAADSTARTAERGNGTGSSTTGATKDT